VAASRSRRPTQTKPESDEPSLSRASLQDLDKGGQRTLARWHHPALNTRENEAVRRHGMADAPKGRCNRHCGWCKAYFSKRKPAVYFGSSSMRNRPAAHPAWPPSAVVLAVAVPLGMCWVRCFLCSHPTRDRQGRNTYIFRTAPRAARCQQAAGLRRTPPDRCFWMYPRRCQHANQLVG
jgi:hypothetical protein